MVGRNGARGVRREEAGALNTTGKNRGQAGGGYVHSGAHVVAVRAVCEAIGRAPALKAAGMASKRKGKQMPKQDAGGNAAGGAVVRLNVGHYDLPHAAPSLLAKLAAAGTIGFERLSKGVSQPSLGPSSLGPTSTTSLLLLHRVSAGESSAIQECIERFGGLVWSLARRAGLPEAELEDAVHEIFTELWHNGHKYDAGIASEAAFVAIIARRRLIDRRRRITRRPVSAELTELNGGGTLPTEGAGVEVAEEAKVAVKALESLSDEQQRVLRLSVYEGLSHELIARATGLPLGTVKTHARRGLIRLREMLSTTDGAAQVSETSPSTGVAP